ncbi:fimbrial protein [Chelativorans sp. AA-79]|uniref:fimbrial protein n=1 Tax=Chelativorans sp. AA-79 TaxID=3028735 RepID=UPI0023F9F8B4|nr:fimbrial protein [Chelativorans sp. AA-79]WEX10015.1 fimbrial protein [Chelativorans sp. AA-79]
MAGPNASLELDEEKPLDPAAERVRRKLVRFMIINLGILFAAVMAVVLAFVYKSVKEPETAVPQPGASDTAAVPSGETVSGDIPLPVGARIISHAASGNRLTLHVALAGDREAILLYDIPERRLIGRFSVTREAR